MERLTEWIGEDEDRQAIPKPDIRKNGHNRCCNKLAEYEDLEEQGRLVKLPFRIGDDAYVITIAGEKHIIPVAVLNISVFVFSVHSENSTDIAINVVVKSTKRRATYHLGDIGKIMFFTREAAEEKVKEMGWV